MPSQANRNSPGKTYPIIQSISGQPDLARELKALREMVYTLQDQHQQSAAQTATPAPTSTTLTAAQLDQIRKALQIGGSHPLNLTSLLS